MTVDFECPRLLLAWSTAKGIDGRTDLDLFETAVFHHLLPVCTRQTTGDSGRPEIDITHRRFRNVIGDIGKL